jgi:colanic acid biosynthesis protein WcaH
LKFIGVFEHFYENSIFENISTHYVNHGYLLEIDEFLDKIPFKQHNKYIWSNVDELLKNKDVHPYVKDYFKIGENK